MGTSDQILAKKFLSKQLFIWRIAVIALIIVILFVGYSKIIQPTSNPYIARVYIRGEIFEDPIREQGLAKIANNPKIKAVIFHISSPGGTTYGGESLYHSIYDINKKKPVVVVMGTVAASAGYMASLGASHIIARNSTITASIGALFISPEFSELAKKIGVNFIVLKKGKLKSEPLPFNGPINKESEAMINSLLEDQYNMFFNLVVKHRKFSKQKLMTIADGRILTGSQAFDAGLIDQIGAEKEAFEWLSSKDTTLKKLKIKGVSLLKPRGIKTIFPLDDLKSAIIGLKDLLKLLLGSAQKT
ncbi:MAG: signal peptide peptidase SppA [Rickettsiales bacterium]|nr:signal peptide peptidase SppA [Rickettsiales bacterium]